VRFPFDDHNPPPLGLFYFFCLDVQEYLAAHPDNVVAIHCKAGKGRTGVMISAYLMWCGDWADPTEAMQFYGFARTANQKGVTIPSQRLFVELFGKTLGGDGGDPASARAAALPLVEAESPASPRKRHTPPQEAAVDEESVVPCMADDSDTDEHEDDERSAADTTPTPATGAGAAEGGGRALGFAELGAMQDAFADLWSGGRPRATRKSRLLNHEWNRQNRLQVPPGSRGAVPPPAVLALTEVVLHHGHYSHFHDFSPSFKIRCADYEYKSSDLLAAEGLATTFKPSPDLVIPVSKALLTDEVFVAFYSKSTVTGAKKKLFCFWFHCSFVENNILVLKKHEIDKACKDKKYGDDFAVELRFETVPAAP